MASGSGGGPFEPTNHPLRWFRPGYLSRSRGIRLEDVEFVAVDFETTGLDPRGDRIVEVAACRFTADGTILDEYASRVNPVTARTGDSRSFHGLTDDDLAESPTFAQVWPELRRMMSGAVVIAHNLRFEDDFLREELRRLGTGSGGQVPGVCMMVASWSHFRKFSYKQKLVFRTVVGTWPEDAHTALGDVRNLSAIFAHLYRRLPQLRYAGPPPVSFDQHGSSGLMHARPIVEAAIQWNSLPMATVDYPVTDAAREALRDGAVRLLQEGSSYKLLIRLMSRVGVGAGQFARLLGTTLVSLLADGTAERSWQTLTELRCLLEVMESQELAEIVIAGVRDRDVFTGIPAPVLAGERWRVPGDHPEREQLVEILSDLGANVLKTARPNLAARVVRQRVERDEAAYDLEPYLAELRHRAADGSAAYVHGWIEEQLARHKSSADVPLGGQTGDPEWDEIMAFVPRDPELAPDWRWAARGYRGDPKAWRHLDVPEEELTDDEEDLWEEEDEEDEEEEEYRLPAEEVRRPAVPPPTVPPAVPTVPPTVPAVAPPAMPPTVPVMPPAVPPASPGGAAPPGSGQRRKSWPSVVFALAALVSAFYATWATVDTFRGESGALPCALILWALAVGFAVASRRRSVRDTAAR
jgi:DNA polymerase III epsilon subunit-like protein